MPNQVRVLALSLCVGLIFTSPTHATAPSPADDSAPPTVVTLGDSITKGVRSGVLAEETFAAFTERALREQGLPARVVNLGIGGERTDQALQRLDTVTDLHPRVVTVMYGTNDSYVDSGKSASRLTVAQYRANLKAIVTKLRERGAQPIVMTEPAWAADAPPNGLGENPNVKLAPFMQACREVAEECGVPLVDHFARWNEAQAGGQSLAAWTTDGCHPNPRGHRELAEALIPILVQTLRPATAKISLENTLQSLQSGRPTRVVCFGDSVTGVYYHTGGRWAYTDLLGIGLKRAFPTADVTTINAGVSGNTTRDALDRIDRDVLRHKPALVTVMFGLNDVARLPLDDYRKNLAEIVARCRAAGAEVLLCTPNNVISTPERPIKALDSYCDVVRELGRQLKTPVCDVYAELEAQRMRDALAWRLTMSDAIHPNLDGHKRISESLLQPIAGKPISLADVPLPKPTLPHVAARIKAGQPIRVLAMPPFDAIAAAALKAEYPDAQVEMTSWPTAGLSLPDLENDARARVRPAPHDLVILAVPRTAQADSLEAFIHGYAWVMNWSLSFALADWDCIVVHPSVDAPEPADAADDLMIRALVRAQGLPLVDRSPDDHRPAAELFRAWLQEQSRGDSQ